jgi:splicing factor 3B subunit 2
LLPHLLPWLQLAVVRREQRGPHYLLYASSSSRIAYLPTGKAKLQHTSVIMAELAASAPALNGKGPRKLTKNEKRRLRKRSEKSAVEAGLVSADEGTDTEAAAAAQRESGSGADAEAAAAEDLSAVEVEYVAADAAEMVDGSGLDDSVAAEFKAIFERFAKAGLADEEEDSSAAAADADADPAAAGADKKAEDAAGSGDEGEGSAKKISRKARKLKSRLSVAELKQLVQRPDVVEAHDVTAADPRLLVHLKAYRNTVPVPRHWCHKRKYLQGKRGIEKKPFELPDFIALTGISKLRDTLDEQLDAKKAKQRSRERVQPKTGKIDIDYQVLHEAFFKYQTKPRLCPAGDIYYEGKEFEVRGREKKPGVLSEALKAALGMPEGAPPPWLINMQRYGPPPSYPHMRIPGLNAPIPPGASFGYHAGGGGKPPVNEAGVPLYGDVFGSLGVEEEQAAIDKSHWGELAEADSSDEEEEEEEQSGDAPGGTETPAGGGAATPLDGAESSMSGLETPDAMLDLRKRGLETPSDAGTPAPRELYTVVGEERTAVGGALFGADKRYNLAGSSSSKAAAAAGGGSSSRSSAAAAAAGDVAVSINPDELELQLEDAEGLRERYEASVASSQPQREDLSDIIAEESRKRKRKLDKASKSGGGAAKKGKEFKF